MDTMMRDFHAEDAMRQTERPRVAPPMKRRNIPAIADAEHLETGDDYTYDERPAPVEDAFHDGEVDAGDVEWAGWLGMRRTVRTREGATFTRIAEDVFVISVLGGQYLHDDRHLADITDEQAVGVNEHSWYLVAVPSQDQMLLVEVADGIYEHLPFLENGLLYMNTVNRHLVSRRSPDDVVVLVQVSGYGPDERDDAVRRLSEVLAARPDVIAE